MRKIVFGDIHGGYKALIELIDKIGVQSSDELIFLGDYVDGWSESPQVIDYLIGLRLKYKCILLKGNHDQLLLDWLTTKKDNPLWLMHGGQSSVDAYARLSDEQINTHVAFFDSLELSYIDVDNRLFVHAGFTNPNGIEAEYFPKMFFWDRTLWETALALDTSIDKESNLYPKRLNLYQEIFIGHTPVTRIGKTVPVQKACVWNVDTGAAFKGPITAMDVESKEFWQSRPVHEYYPEEEGRN
ncbi:MAG: serine/threonine protein phosphatase [Flavobacteriales bacterium]|nr:serine/threonine protein phosphatase [Flavobacteriales bacterium]